MASFYLTMSGLVFAIMSLAEVAMPSKARNKIVFFTGMAIFNFLAAMTIWQSSLGG